VKKGKQRLNRHPGLVLEGGPRLRHTVPVTPPGRMPQIPPPSQGKAPPGPGSCWRSCPQRAPPHTHQVPQQRLVLLRGLAQARQAVPDLGDDQEVDGRLQAGLQGASRCRGAQTGTSSAALLAPHWLVSTARHFWVTPPRQPWQARGRRGASIRSPCSLFEQ